MQYMYHATPMENLYSIMDEGIHPGTDGVVYMCEKPEDSAKFLAVRMIREILVCKIKIYKKDEKLITETFDHSERFFKCRAFGYHGHISPEMIEGYYKYEI